MQEKYGEVNHELFFFLFGKKTVLTLWLVIIPYKYLTLFLLYFLLLLFFFNFFQASGGVESSVLVESGTGTPVDSSVSVIGGGRGSAGGTVKLQFSW